MDIITILLTALLLVIIIIDIRSQIIPDALNALLAWLAVYYLALTLPIGFWWWNAASAFVLGGIGAFFAGPYSRWRGRDMMGWGDVKFFAAAGLWLPLPTIWLFLTLAGIFGVIGALIYRAKTGRVETPFAPALCVSLWLTVLYSNTIIGYFTRWF